ncbi:hypothetical protein M1P56_17930 [Streptomyces sp. HU2014]|uniref:hypothetical protein n=1 Tax=Streptomyces TaxID=1883 RepID=UPI00133115D6|nr:MULTISPECIES: hypothetical protein [Streptomyces]UQI46090.1 hypothetical protein M1P56_17930 [Streptomyces sp. HU2014]
MPRQTITLHLETEERQPSFTANGAAGRAPRASRDKLKIMESSRGLSTTTADPPPRLTFNHADILHAAVTSQDATTRHQERRTQPEEAGPGAPPAAPARTQPPRTRTPTSPGHST